MSGPLVRWRPISFRRGFPSPSLWGLRIDDKQPLPPVGWIGLGRVRHSNGGQVSHHLFMNLSSDTRLAFDFVCWVVLIEVAVSDSCQNPNVCRTTAWDCVCGGFGDHHRPSHHHRAGVGEMTFSHSISRVVSGVDNLIFPSLGTRCGFRSPPLGHSERNKDIQPRC